MAQTRPQMMPNGGPPGSLGLASHVSGLPIRLPSFWSYLPKNYANAQVPVQYQQVPGAFYQRPAGAAAGQQLLSFAPRLGIPQYLGSPLQQQAQLSPRLVQLRDARALSQASSVLPQGSSTAQTRGTDSPLAAKVPATKVEFLPKAVNVKTSPLTDGAAAQPESHVRVGECSSCSTECVGIYVQSCDVITRAWQAIVCSPSTTSHCAASRTSKQSRLCAVLP